MSQFLMTWQLLSRSVLARNHTRVIDDVLVTNDDGVGLAKAMDLSHAQQQQ